jgi:hypothetical protein
MLDYESIKAALVVVYTAQITPFKTPEFVIKAIE